MSRFAVAGLGPSASLLAICLASTWAQAQTAAGAQLPAQVQGPSPGQAPARVTLDQAVARALAYNPTVAVAVAEIDRAEALIRQARAASYPALLGNVVYTRLEGDRYSAPGVKVASRDQIAGNLMLTVPLFAPVAWSQTRHAEDNRRVAEASAVDVRRQLAVATARTYLAVVAQHRVITANENARNTAQAHYDYAHTRLIGGIGRSIDEVRAEQELRANEVAVEGAYAGLARVREALGVLVAAEGPVDTREEVALAAPPSLDTALGDARARRADVKVLETRLAAGEELVQDDWVYYAPILSAAAQPFFQEGLPLQPHVGWQAQLILALPFYDGGQRTGIAREREALVVEARANLDAATRQARSDVRAAFDAVVHADRGLAAARAASALARRALELTTLAYRAGATSNLEVIDASRASRAADTAAVQAEDLARQGRLDLLAASGRFP